jgi:hypothetical protein
MLDSENIKQIERFEMFSEEFIYDPESGELKWRHLSGNRKPFAIRSIGSHGYLQVNFNSFVYLVHNLVWYLYYGEWAIKPIDHIDRNKLNNVISNLRLADHSVNGHNRGLISTNTSGVKGVSHDWRSLRKPWHAYIDVQGKRISLGHFVTKDEAIQARQKAEQTYVAIAYQVKS